MQTYSAILQRERSTLSASELRTLSQIGQTEEQLQDVSRVWVKGGHQQHAIHYQQFPPIHTQTVLGVILGGGAGTRLYPLTKTRAKPAVPLGANYRLIDIPVSNCINSNINKIYCLTQFNSASLNRHLSSAYVRAEQYPCVLVKTQILPRPHKNTQLIPSPTTQNSNVGGYNTRGFVEVLAASQSPVNKNWFQGTADAVRQYLWLFDDAIRDGVQDLLILSGDHLYRMDYSEFVKAHRATGADITVSALPCAEKEASAFGLMKIDSEGRIVVGVGVVW